MSNVAQKRPFASLLDDEFNDSTPPLSPFQPIPEEPVFMTIAEKKWCNQTIKALKKHKRAIAFLDPVDPIQFDIPDYFQIVKSPMDFGTIDKKLLADKYSTVQEFKSDIQLVFDNCYLYNHSGDPVCLDAKKLEEHYHKLCKKEVVGLAVTSVHELSSKYHSSPKNLIPTPTTPSAESNSLKLKVRLPATTPNYTISSSEPPPKEIIESDDRADIFTDDQFKRCEAIVRELKKPKYQGLSWPFRNPVDAAAWGATDYYDIIKQPMDMTSYERKLHNFEYHSENELVDDIRLMFRNCYAYNPPDHLVHNLGKEFEQVFEKQWAKLQARKHHKKSSSSTSTKSAPKKQRTSVETLGHNMPDQTVRDASIKADSDNLNCLDDTKVNLEKNDSVSSATSKPDENRSTILRLKVLVKPKEKESLAPKPITKPPILALSKEPPSTKVSSIVSPFEKKRSDNNHYEKMFEPSKKSPSPIKKIFKEVATPSSPPPPPVLPKPKEPVTPAFDINDLYNKIHNEKKINDQKKRKEQEQREKNERARLEKENALHEERLKQKREADQRKEAQRQKDVKERLRKLNTCPIDISTQKLTFSKFESTHMARDQDWREVYTWQRETIDYRHIPVSAFIKRAPINLSELRKQLLSKCVRLRNSKVTNYFQTMDDGSDMDIE